MHNNQTSWERLGNGCFGQILRYLDECNRQLNDAKFYRQLDGDITDTIQERVTVYIERMFNDGYIDVPGTNKRETRTFLHTT